MDRRKKSEFIAEMHGVFQSSKIVLVAGYSGLTVAQLKDLRVRMGEVGASVKVVKNRLAQRALEGTHAVVSAPLFKGPVLVVCSEDLTAAPKVAMAFSKENPSLSVFGAAMEGMFLDQAAVKSLAELPSMDELRARILSVIQTPATRIAAVLQAPGAQLARVMTARAEQSSAA